MRYLAYFQAYTSTHAEMQRLRALYDEALTVDDVVGIVIGTRPDCLPDDLLALLRSYVDSGKYVLLELGAESSHDSTLKIINRCHSWADTVAAVERISEAGIDCGLHLINGLPGETPEMILKTVDRLNNLPVETVKFHQLQLIRGTRMALDVEAGLYDIPRWTAEEYIELCCDIVGRIRPDIAIERFVSQSPDSLLIWPRWGLKNYQFTDRLRNRLARR